MGQVEDAAAKTDSLRGRPLRDVVRRGSSGTVLDEVSGTVAYAVIKTGAIFANFHHYPVR
jgi:hypothetical protein